MKTRNTRVMALALAAVMMTSVFTANAAVETTAPDIEEAPISTASNKDAEDAGLQAAIVLVKTRYTIPESMSKFTFYTGKKDAYTGLGYYRLTWEDEEALYSINATVEGDLITQFNYNYYGDTAVTRPTFPKMSKAQLISKAKALVKKLNPTIADKLVLDENSYSTGINNTDVYFSIRHMENGFNTPDSGYIRVDKNTGELSNFYMNYNQSVTYAKPESYITQAQAQQAFADQIGFKIGYYLTTDYETGERTANLYYTMDNEKYLPIDALTGKVIDFYATNSGDETLYGAVADEMETESAMGDADAGAKITLTPEELKAIDELSKLITEDQALKILRDQPYSFVDSSYTVSSSSVYRDNENEPYYWSLSLDGSEINGAYNATATVDAEDGRIISFQNYNDIFVTENGKKVYGRKADFFDKKFDEAAETAAQSFVGDDFDNYVLQRADLSRYYVYPEPENKADIIYGGKVYTYIRTLKSYTDSDGNSVSVNLPVNGDTFSVYVGFDGKVMRYNGYQPKDYELPSPEKMLTVDEIVGKIFPDQLKLNIAYAVTYSEDKGYISALLYTMGNFEVDAFTGQLTNEGAPESEDADDIYSDIKGTSYEAMVNKLAENGIAIADIDGQLKANEAISKRDWLSLVSRLTSGSWDPIFNAEYSKMWSDPAALDAKLSRADAIKLFIAAIGGSQFAELKGIYASPFADIKSDDANIGYFALANALGALLPDKSGNARPNASLTRLSALIIAYNYILSGSK
jgi:hypothetical protein